MFRDLTFSCFLSFVVGNHRVSSKPSLFQLGLQYKCFAVYQESATTGQICLSFGRAKAKKLSASGEGLRPLALTPPLVTENFGLKVPGPAPATPT